MTKIEPGRPVIRETGSFEHADPLVVELHNTHLVIRVKGKQSNSITVTYAQLFRHGAKLPGGRA